MDVEFKGANCLVINAKKTTIIVDPKLSGLGISDQAEKASVQLLTQPEFKVSTGGQALVIDGPGEYEVDNVSIKGIAARGYMDTKTDPLRATIYRIETADVSLGILGHIQPDLSDEQLEAIGIVDVLAIPVGGNGYTLDATGAIQLIRKIEPKAVVPTHYAEKGLAYPVPQRELDVFLNELGAVNEETSKLKLKSGSFPDKLIVYTLKRTA
jgi:L-ascorbate metabolism protein UlaG (beta-lactamase superfamily)